VTTFKVLEASLEVFTLIDSLPVALSIEAVEISFSSIRVTCPNVFVVI
jgi:hypothetical protein